MANGVDESQILKIMLIFAVDNYGNLKLRKCVLYAFLGRVNAESIPLYGFYYSQLRFNRTTNLPLITF